MVKGTAKQGDAMAKNKRTLATVQLRGAFSRESPSSKRGKMKRQTQLKKAETSTRSAFADLPVIAGNPYYSSILINELFKSSPEAQNHPRAAVIFAVTAFESIDPRDGLERLLATQMVGVHSLAMQFLARAASKDQSGEALDKNVSRATKLMRTFVDQIEALKLYRSTGQQKVVVEHVHVNQGGQAIVGVVKTEIKS